MPDRRGDAARGGGGGAAGIFVGAQSAGRDQPFGHLVELRDKQVPDFGKSRQFHHSRQLPRRRLRKVYTATGRAVAPTPQPRNVRALITTRNQNTASCGVIRGRERTATVIALSHDGHSDGRRIGSEDLHSRPRRSPQLRMHR